MNKRNQLLLRQSRLYRQMFVAKHLLTDGLYCEHDFNEANQHCWLDFTLATQRQLIIVRWISPDVWFAEQQSNDDGTVALQITCKYKMVGRGKNRKKRTGSVISYTFDNASCNENQIRKIIDFESKAVLPYPVIYHKNKQIYDLSIRQTVRGRVIDLCSNHQIHTLNDLHQLKDWLKDFLCWH